MTGSERLVRLAVEIRQAIVVVLAYTWRDRAYTYWGASFADPPILSRTPFYDRAVLLAKEALSLWSSGKKDDATTKARFCLDIAKVDGRFAEWFAAGKIPHELKSAADEQASAVYWSAFSRKAVGCLQVIVVLAIIGAVMAGLEAAWKAFSGIEL